MNKTIKHTFVSFAQAYSHSPDPTLVANKDGTIIYVNPAWEKHTGYQLKEVIGINPRFLGSGKTPKVVYKKLWSALLKGKSFNTEDVINKKKDGTEYQIHASYYPIRDKNETIVFVQVIYDITEQKEYEKMRKAFLSMAGHELKTPITTLKLLTQVLRKRVEIYEKGNKSFDMLDNEFDRLTDLVDQMLDLSRVETGKMVISQRNFDLNALLKSTIKKIQLLSYKHKIVLRKSKEYIVKADDERIEQVLTNLLTNAIKYSPPDTIITVSLEEKGDKVIVSIQDNGYGIPSEKLPHIFEKFYQVRDSGKIGFGLGLYICSEIIKLHKEKLWVKSKEGKGSTFYFSLKLCDM